MKPVHYPFLLTCALITVNAAAQDVPSADADASSPNELATRMRKISVTATRGPEALGNIPSTVSVIDSNEMPQFVPGGYLIVDLLAQASVGAGTQFNLGVFNLFDRKYWEWSDVKGVLPTHVALDRYTRPGINVGASVAVRF